MADDSAEYIRRSEFRELATDVRDIDREIAAMKGEIVSTKADMQEIKQGQRDMMVELKRTQSVRGMVTGGWAAVGTGFALGLARVLGVAP